MSVFQDERVGSELDYVDRQILVFRQDYLANYEPKIDPLLRQSIGWEALYERAINPQLQDFEDIPTELVEMLGEKEKAIDFMAVRFLQMCVDGLDGIKGQAVHIPALDEFHRRVSDRFRDHLSNLVAESNGLIAGLYRLPRIDWDNPQKYLSYAEGSGSQEKLAHIRRFAGALVTSNVMASSTYLFDNQQDISGVTYHFTPSA